MPAAVESIAGDADLDRLLGLEQVQGDPAQWAEVLGPVAAAETALVLIEADVQAPVRTVLHVQWPHTMAGSRRAPDIARLTGCRVVRLNEESLDYFSRRMMFMLDAGPAEWPGYLANAAFVMGQSFHATAFAANFGRPLFSLRRSDRDHAFRQWNIVSIFGLEHRAITMGDAFPRRIGLNKPLVLKRRANLAAGRERSLF